MVVSLSALRTGRLYPISVRGWVDCRAIVQSEGFVRQWKMHWHWLGSNQRPSDLQHSTLTTELPRSAFPEVENIFLNIMYVTCRLKIVSHSIIRYEIVVIKRTLDIYMNTQLPLFKVCYNPIKEALVFIWYLFACFGKTLKITCMRFSVWFVPKTLSTDRIFCLYQSPYIKSLKMHQTF